MAEVSGGRHRAPETVAGADLPAPGSARVAKAPELDCASQGAPGTTVPTYPWRTPPRPPGHPRDPRHARSDEADGRPDWPGPMSPRPAETLELGPSGAAPEPSWPDPVSARPESSEQTSVIETTSRPNRPHTDRRTPVPITTQEESTAANKTTKSPDGSVDFAPGPLGNAAPAIEVIGVRKVFGDHVAVDDVSFTVAPGTILGLLGPNGAGKTTTVNMLCTLLRPDAGTARINGHDVIHDAAAVRRSIMLTGQFAALDEALTGRENLILFGRLLGLPKSAAASRADELLEYFELTKSAGRRVREYSGGMRRRIDIACGLVTAPKVVFLDEPTTGLDPRSRQEVWRLVEGLRDSGVTTLLTTQYLEEADVLSDRIVVIDKGRVIADGTAAELKAGIGSAFYEVTPRNPGDVDRVRHLLADLGTRQGDAASDAQDRVDDVSVSVPAPNGASTLVEIVRRTTDADVELSDVTLRTPTLDEVFLALTGDNDAGTKRTEAAS